MGTHQARCCLLGAGCTLLAVGTLRESRCSVRAGAVTSYSAAISWTGQGEAGGGGRGWVAPHCLLVSVLGVYLCVTTCTGARDPTESPLSQVRCGVLSMCGVPSSSGGEHGAQLPTTSCRHITHADTTGDCNAHTLESNQKCYLLLSSLNKIFVCYVLSSIFSK